MKVLRRILETLGCVCTSAFNGVEGVQAFESVFVPPYTDAYDIVATDLEMPLMNGLEAIRVIRGMEQHARYPIAARANGRGKLKKFLAAHNESNSSANSEASGHSSSDESEASAQSRSSTQSTQSAHSARSATLNVSAASSLTGSSAAGNAQMNLVSQTKALTASELASLPPPCYLLCISGNVRTEFVDAAREAGADEYLGKPFEKQALKNALSAAKKKQKAYLSSVHAPTAVAAADGGSTEQ